MIRKTTGKILANGPDINISDTDGCAVRFTGAPRKDKVVKQITVSMMKALLYSKSVFLTQRTHSESNESVRMLAEQNERTNFFFGLPTSSVSHLVP